jgi:DHA1 family tetracycline resistance protein-like MFS transporter
MAYSSAGLAIGFLMVTQCRSPGMLLLAGSVDGLSSCMGAICQAYVSDLCADEESRGKNLALLQGVSLTGAFIFGMPISAIISTKVAAPAKALAKAAAAALAAGDAQQHASLSQQALAHPSVALSHRYPVYIAAASQLVALLAAALIPESLPVERRASSGAVRRVPAPWEPLKLFFGASLRKLALAFLLMYVANAIMNDCIQLLTGHLFGWTAQQLAPLLIVVGGLLAIVPQVLIPALGVRRSIMLCQRLFAVGYVCLSVSSSPAALYASTALIAVGCAALPLMLVLLTSYVPPTQQGKLLGATEGLKTIGMALSAATAPGVFGFFISERSPVQLPGAPYLFGAALAAAANLIQSGAMAVH